MRRSFSPATPASRVLGRAAGVFLVIAAATLAHRHLAHGQSELPAYTHFETEPVRPVALSADGRILYVLNTADDYLEVYEVTETGLVRVGETPVGLRPAAVAVVGGTAWVTNLLSDSVSVVDVSDPAGPTVIHTLRVGDEPRDIVVGGPNGDLVFVATARRTDLTTPGAGRGAVWVFQASDPSADPAVVTLLGMKPRALAVSADGSRVFAAVFKSGNGTTVVGEPEVTAGGGPPPPQPSPKVDEPAPRTGLIVSQDGDRWFDEGGGEWTNDVPFTISDTDVFILDATRSPPAISGAIPHAGTILFNMAVHPGTGALWVSNTDARNAVRFEPNVKGNVTPSRITVVDMAPRAMRFVPLNPHIDRAVPGTAAERALSLAQPLQIAFSDDGQRAYVAAFLSGKAAELDAAGTVLRRFDVGMGPAGLAVDETGGRLFVLNSLDSSLSTVNLASGATTTQPLHHDPQPIDVRAGRRFLYDAQLVSGHGDMSCASCHIFADNDGLAWDLGDPTGDILPMTFDLTHPNIVLKPSTFEFHPMKGPMVTQSFRGMAEAGPMHWRGDRFSTTDPDDELDNFRKFNPAFVSLNGRETELADQDMDAFGRFLLSIHYAPNPIQNLDRSFTAQQKAGFDTFTGEKKVDSGVTNCAGCHALPLGTNGRVNFEGNRASQDFKAPHLRALYEKVGRFHERGAQLSGFGFTHDGSVDTLATFLQEDMFDFGAPTEIDNNRIRTELQSYLLAFDTGMAPLVGHGPTVSGPITADHEADLALLMSRSQLGDCDLVAHARLANVGRGWTFNAGQFRPDRERDNGVGLQDLLDIAQRPESPVSFVCVPPGSGIRSGIDRDLDGYLNGDEIDEGSDPGNASSVPGGTAIPADPTGTAPIEPRDRAYLPICRR